MLAAQRQAHILEAIGRVGAVRVRELAADLRVSDMTVRRDLEALSRRGLVDKVHGGALVADNHSTDEPGFAAKSGRERAAKDAIGRRAAHLVERGSSIAISAGTTTHAFAGHLLAVPDLTVVTNSFRVAQLFWETGRSGGDVILAGGQRTPSDALVGPLTVAALRALHVDTVFMGVHGIDDRAGLTTPNLMEAETDRAMVAMGRDLVVLADHTKWGVVGLSQIARLTDVSLLVTDAGLAPSAQDALGPKVGELIIASGEQSKEAS